jgi:archaellum biogenesis protein FlaJ (TadC family)
MEFLRAKRGQISSSFNWLAMGIHASLVGLLVFITEIVTTFGNIVEEVYSEALEGSSDPMVVDAFSFNLGNIGILNTLTMPCLLVMAAATAFAVNATDGGSRQKLYLYLAITFGMSGAAMIFIPEVSKMLFSTVSM